MFKIQGNSIIITLNNNYIQLICFLKQNTDIASHLKLPPVKLHCSMLAEDAMKAAVADYKSKNVAKQSI